jgi:hypothetical protein
VYVDPKRVALSMSAVFGQVHFPPEQVSVSKPPIPEPEAIDTHPTPVVHVSLA